LEHNEELELVRAQLDVAERRIIVLVFELDNSKRVFEEENRVLKVVESHQWITAYIGEKTLRMHVIYDR